MLKRYLQSSFKLFLCFIILFLSMFGNADYSLAAEKLPYDHDALLDYHGYGEAMYETAVRESAFATGQYTKNKQYVSDTIDQMIDYSKFWLNELDEFGKAKRIRDLISIPGGALLTIGDQFKKMFTGYGEKYHPSLIDTSAYDEYVTLKPGTTQQYQVKLGYVLKIGDYEIDNSKGYLKYEISGSWVGDFSFAGCTNVDSLKADVSFVVGNKYLSERTEFKGSIVCDMYHFGETVSNFGQVVWAASKFNLPLVFEKDGIPVIQPSKPSNDYYQQFKKYIDEQLNQIATPEPKPFLACSNGAKIQLSVSGSTFLSSDGSIVAVNKDGTSIVDSSLCNLNWEKPVVKYDDEDRAVIETPEGDWKDILTGLITSGGNGMQCVENGQVVPCNDVEKPDGSILAYIKNAYEYATGVIRTGVDGLKSLGTGAVELTKLYGVFFGWLPKEIVVLMTSGLAIMLGLRIFRK